jgi:hypothetical protein
MNNRESAGIRVRAEALPCKTAMIVVGPEHAPDPPSAGRKRTGGVASAEKMPGERDQRPSRPSRGGRSSRPLKFKRCTADARRCVLGVVTEPDEPICDFSKFSRASFIRTSFFC